MKIRKTKYTLPAVIVLICLFMATAANADLITSGFTFSVASGGNAVATGTHYHSNTGGAFGNPAGKAEVGRFGTEEVRGLSEYNITGLATATSAFVTFNVFKAGGLFRHQRFSLYREHQCACHQGNKRENISDYQAASLGLVGSFGTAGLLVGNILSFDITSDLNDAINNGRDSLGIRLPADPLKYRGAWTFDKFRLTTDNQTTVPGPRPCCFSDWA